MIILHPHNPAQKKLKEQSHKIVYLFFNRPDSTPDAHEGAGQLKAETKALKLGSFDAHVLLNDVAPEAELNQLRFQVVLQHVVLGVHYAGQIKDDI
jgi:hypothetical protein